MQLNEGEKVTVILGIIVLGALSYGIVDVYGERSVVEVPFDYHGHGCTFDRENVVFTCRWEGSSETVRSDATKDAGIVPPEQVLEESKEAHENAVALRDEVDTEKSAADVILERLQDKIDEGIASDSERELHRVLEEVKTKCYFGVEEGRLIQKFESHDLPDVTVDKNPMNNMDYKNQLGKIVKLLEACKAWDEYKGKFLGDEYINKIDDDSTSQGYHADVAKDKTPYKSHELTPEDYLNSQDKAKATICGHSYYSQEFKQNAGCFPTEDIIPGPGIDFTKNNPAFKAYKQYMESGGWVDLATLKKEQQNEALNQSADSFAQQQQVDPADLKNWLMEQREKKGGQR